MKIERYELVKNDKYNVFLSNGEVLTLPENVITENELLLKKELSQDLYEKVNRDSLIYDLVSVAIKYISIRLRSISEIKAYLSKKNSDKDLIESATKKLIALGYLDDERFTQAFIKDKLNFTTMGDYKIRMELQKLGVDSQIIESNISSIDDDVITQRMEKVIAKDLKTNKKLTGNNLKNKIYNHLLNQGYSKEKVITVINKYSF